MTHTKGELEYNIVATNSIDIVSKEDESIIVATIISEDDELGSLEKGNAHHIIHRWNCHDELVKVLGEIVRHIIHNDPKYAESAWFPKAKAALAKARKLLQS